MSKNRYISRRNFLVLSAATVAGCATTRPAVIAPVAGLGVGVIGCGARGTELLNALKSEPAYSGVRMAAVCDIYEPRKQRAGALSGAPVVHEWRELIARDDVDAVIIATPDHWHAPMAIAAMEAGKDVYCESPMALTLAQAAEFRACAARAQRIVQIGSHQASDAHWHVAAGLIRDGKIGPVRWAQAPSAPGVGEAWNVPVEAAATPSTLDWNAFTGASDTPFDAQRYFRWRNYWDYSGGIATGLYYDQIVPLLLALGPDYPARVSAAGGIYVEDGRETPDSFVMNAEYGSGATIVLAHSASGRADRPAVIRGESASIELAKGTARVIPEPGAGAAEDRTLTAEPRQTHMGNWFECIKSRQKCLCNEDLGYQAMVAVAMALDAYKNAKTVRYDVASNAILPAPPRTAIA